MSLLRLHRAGRAALLVALVYATHAQGQPSKEALTLTSPSLRGSDVTDSSPEDQLLQLDVFVNGRPLQLVAAFTLHPDGQISTSKSELQAIGLKVPATAHEKLEVPLDSLGGVSYRYDEAAQAIHITAAASAIVPTLISGQQSPSTPTPSRPPFGAVLNYTLFSDVTGGTGARQFGDIAGEFDTRVFDRWGLVENNFVGRMGNGSDLVRLDTSYSYEDRDALWTAQAGDLVSGGFSWSRPIRMAGLQIRRDFGLRPDLITMPLPTLTGTAAAASTIDLYVDQVHALTASVPQGPYAIQNLPLLNGSGQAQVVVKDALGRETVSMTPFYASPELLAAGLDDYSAEIGFARRNYGSLSNDYDGDFAVSGSYRRGMASWLTLEGHGEAMKSLAVIGGGGVVQLWNFGLVSVAASGSSSGGGSGGLLNLGFESRSQNFTITLNSQRTVGDYEDLASWTAELPKTLPVDRRIFDQPKALDQAAISFPLPWGGASVGASYVHISRYDGERSEIAGLSYSQDLGRLSFFANAMRDFNNKGSAYLFLGLSMSLGDITATAGATAGQGKNAGYVEASHQGADDPGSFNWSARASEGQQTEAYGIGRYNASQASFEGTGLYRDGTYSGTAMMEGALSMIGGGVHATQRLDDAFTLVDVGVPDVPVSRENRLAGTTGSDGTLLVPDLVPFVGNHITIDPTGLPVDAEVSRTEATTTPFDRVGTIVDLRVKTDTSSALVSFVDPEGRPLPLGSGVRLSGDTEEFVVGYDGQAFLANLKSDNDALITTQDGARCRASFNYAPVAGQQPSIGPIICRSME